MHSYLSICIPGIHQHVAGTLSKEQTPFNWIPYCLALSLKQTDVVSWFIWSSFSYSCVTEFSKREKQIEVLWRLFVGCLTSEQQASVSQGRICSHNFTCCHTEIEVADQSFYLTQSQYNDTSPTSPSADPITPGTWQGSHWSANFWVTGMTWPRKIPSQAGFKPQIFRSGGGCLNH